MKERKRKGRGRQLVEGDEAGLGSNLIYLGVSLLSLGTTLLLFSTQLLLLSLFNIIIV